MTLDEVLRDRLVLALREAAFQANAKNPEMHQSPYSRECEALVGILVKLDLSDGSR